MFSSVTPAPKRLLFRFSAHDYQHFSFTADYRHYSLEATKLLTELTCEEEKVLIILLEYWDDCVISARKRDCTQVMVLVSRCLARKFRMRSGRPRMINARN